MPEPRSENTSNAVVEGRLVRVRAEKDGWFAGEVATQRGNVDVSGGVGATPCPGCHLRLTGSFHDHPVYGRQFKFTVIEASLPTDSAGVEEFLKTIPEIGKSRAAMISRELGGQAVTKILADPACLAKVPGIGKSLTVKIAAAIAEKKNTAVTEQQLCAMGLSTSQRKKARDLFGEQVDQTLSEDPYKFVSVPGVSFATVDRYVLAVKNWSRSDPRRLSAAIVQAAKHSCEWGHTWSPGGLLREGASRVASTPLSPEDFSVGLERAVTDGFVVRIETVDGYALSEIAENETYVAERIAQMLASPRSLGGIDLVSEERRSRLTTEQAAAVETAVRERVAVLTGGPGRGKTFTLAAILEAFGGADVAFCAPTGKAAKRASESVGIEATTIHRLIGRLARIGDEDEDVSTENWPTVVVIDECSMVDVSLMARLLRSLEPVNDSLRLVLVGDADQLPSIGPGRVLADLIDAGVPTARLTLPMRQAAESRIVKNADNVNDGSPIDSSPTQNGDWFSVYDEDAERLSDKVVKLFTERSRAAGFDPETDVVVLSPQRKTPLGVETLNQKIRDFVNPPDGSPEIVDKNGKSLFRAKDRVLVTQNDYELGVVNGDTGIVCEVIPKNVEEKKEARVAVVVDDRRVEFVGDQIKNLTHAWAMTVHKSQGSEYPLVIVVSHDCMKWGLQRCLLYTAITRGKKRVVLTGTERAVKEAIANDKPMVRFTALRRFVEERAVRSSSPNRETDGDER